MRKRATPWRALLSGRNLYAICAMYFAFGYGLYFYFTWLPTYLIKELGFSQFSGGRFAALQFLIAGLADLGGGMLTDRLSRDYGLRVGRCYLGAASFACGAAFLLASTLTAAPVAKAVLVQEIGLGIEEILDFLLEPEIVEIVGEARVHSAAAR